MRLLDKKADERILSFYWIIIFVLIAIAIVSATYFFYKAPFDIREVEARVLNDKIVECIAKNGFIRKDNIANLGLEGQTLEEVCGLNFDDSSYDKNQYYIEININGGNSAADRVIIFDKDDSGEFKELCGQDAEKYPVCHTSRFSVLDDDGNYGSDGGFVFVEVITSVNKVNQNVK